MPMGFKVLKLGFILESPGTFLKIILKPLSCLQRLEMLTLFESNLNMGTLPNPQMIYCTARFDDWTR